MLRLGAFFRGKIRWIGSKLARGTRLVSGANIVLEGPARLGIVSAMRCVLYNGKVCSHVPPQARGFTITSGEATFIDLGTDFGLEVSDAGSARLHVFEGEVEAVAASGEPWQVTGGNGLSIGKGRVWTRIRPEEGRFVDSRRMAELNEEAGSGRYWAWRELRDKMLARPDLVSYFDFESHSEGSTVLKNRAAEGTNGAIVGCRCTEGRWSEKRALDFKRPTDQVRFFVPGEFESLTLMASIRVDGYDRLLNSIMLTDGFDLGKMHWQVKSDGRMDLGIKPPDDCRSRPVATARGNRSESGFPCGSGTRSWETGPLRRGAVAMIPCGISTGEWTSSRLSRPRWVSTRSGVSTRRPVREGSPFFGRP